MNMNNILGLKQRLLLTITKLTDEASWEKQLGKLGQLFSMFLLSWPTHNTQGGHNEHLRGPTKRIHRSEGLAILRIGHFLSIICNI